MFFSLSLYLCFTLQGLQIFDYRLRLNVMPFGKFGDFFVFGPTLELSVYKLLRIQELKNIALSGDNRLQSWIITIKV